MAIGRRDRVGFCGLDRRKHRGVAVHFANDAKEASLGNCAIDGFIVMVTSVLAPKTQEELASVGL